MRKVSRLIISNYYRVDYLGVFIGLYEKRTVGCCKELVSQRSYKFIKTNNSHEMFHSHHYVTKTNIFDPYKVRRSSGFTPTFVSRLFNR